MSSIPDFGASLPKKFKSASMGDIPALDTKSLFRMVVLGPSFTGKNNLCMFILKHSPHVFAHLTIIARNPHQELCEYLCDKLDGFITFADPDAPPSVDQVRHTPISSNKPELIIIDDYSNDKLLQKNLFSHYYTRGRHFKLSTIFLSHSYFAIDKMIRLNSEYVAILKANSNRDLQMVVKDFNIKGVDERSIVYYYNKATERKGQMLFIDSAKGQIRYNFDSQSELRIFPIHPSEIWLESYTITMASFLKLDNTNLVQDGTNSTWKYSFPGSAADFRDVVCAIQSITMYNSEYNIDSFQFQNTTFKLEVPTAATTSIISVSLQDGIYSLPVGYTRTATGLYSSGGSGLPSTTLVPRLIISNAEFGKVLGLTAGTYTAASATVASAKLSNINSQIRPTSSYIVRCDLIKNEYVASGDIVGFLIEEMLKLAS
ncbi:unnamed protein product [Phytophthora fragariaefolia]|uniref:Unnamed protein product n=1 Tax=Phytophthora fragariaefolia TaxID=1490495 RepID=A0A9W6XTU9_9STRA|nr:unnamed protein product [Phytophthora fragariaefolia]